MTPAQCRAARGFLDMTQAQLADRARVGLSTVKNFEAGRSTPIPKNLDDLLNVLAAEGVTTATRGEEPGPVEYIVTWSPPLKGRRGKRFV
jgi:transcriptional regulator with XRE-family HTH domain